MERDYRPLIVALVLSAVSLFGGWKLGLIGEHPPVYIPSFFDQIQLGMTLAELEALGGRPHASDAPAGPLHVEFRGDVARERGFIYGDPFAAETRFAEGRLVRFELRDGGYTGALVEPEDLSAVISALADAQVSGRRYSADALVDALGKGLRVARIVDAEHGAIDVFRWDAEIDGRRVARLEASVASGQVIEHKINP